MTIKINKQAWVNRAKAARAGAKTATTAYTGAIVALKCIGMVFAFGSPVSAAVGLLALAVFLRSAKQKLRSEEAAQLSKVRQASMVDKIDYLFDQQKRSSSAAMISNMPAAPVTHQQTKKKESERLFKKKPQRRPVSSVKLSWISSFFNKVTQVSPRSYTHVSLMT